MSFLSNLFGNTKVTPGQVNPAQNIAPIANYSPSGFTGGGLTGSFSGNNFGVSADAGRTGAVSSLANSFGAFGNATGDLRATVVPGFNDLLKSRLTDLGNQATSAIGNLRQNLQSRRILGSSFGNDTISRAQNTIQQQRDAVIADNFQKSLEANNQLLVQQYGAYAKQYQTGLDELNLEASTASGLTNTASQLMAANAQLMAKLNEQGSEFNSTINEKGAEFNSTMSNNQAGGFGKLVGIGASLGLAPFTGGASLAALPAFK